MLSVFFTVGILACSKSVTAPDSSASNAAQQTETASQATPTATTEIDMPLPPKPSEFKAPESALSTPSGLRYAILKPISGSEKPSAGSQVTVHYSGWLSDGTPFDSSVQRGKPAQFLLSQVIAGWTEGLQLMGKGEQARFWIPEALAYQGQPGYPPGDLVFDVSLLGIVQPPKALGAPTDTDVSVSPEVKKRQLTAGSDTPVAMSDLVEVHMIAWDAKGGLLDSTKMAGQSMRVPVAQIDPMIQSLLLTMKIGESAHFWMTGHPVSQVQIDVLSVQSLPQAPKDVAAPPASAVKTASGLHYQSLQSGIGKVNPGPTSNVTVHYSGWTTDGQMFDSSVVRGQPAAFPLNAVIAGWTEGLQLMTVGQKMRFWIPESLAYKGQSGAPAGMLVFDVELISIDN